MADEDVNNLQYPSKNEGTGIQHKPPTAPKGGSLGQKPQNFVASTKSRPVSAKTTRLLRRPTSAKLALRKEVPSSTQTLSFEGPEAQPNPVGAVRPKRRTQSAKARLDDVKDQYDTDKHFSSDSSITDRPAFTTSKLTIQFEGSNVYDKGMIKGKRKIQSANARLQTGDKAKKGEKQNDRKENDAGEHHKCRSQSYHSGGRPLAVVPQKCQQESNELLKPFVYGYTSKKTIFGSDGVSSRGEENQEFLPYRFADKVETDENGDKTSEFEWIPEDGEPARLMPKSLEPLRHWLTEDIPRNLIGIDPEWCLVFLPSLVNVHELPVVPPTVTSAQEELPYKEKIVPPEPWAPKKYPHPFTAREVEEWKCQHNHQVRKPRVSIFNKHGKLIHQSYKGKRTADIVRKEIKELENLMKGIGASDGASLVVQYQAEISNMRRMINNNMSRIREIEKRDHAKLEAEESRDPSGLKKFYKEHDQVMRHIKKQHDECVQELASLEEELDIDSEKRHFAITYHPHNGTVKHDSNGNTINNNKNLVKVDHPNIA